MTAPASRDVITSGSMEIRWHSESRLAVLRFSGDTSLNGTHGAAIVAALRGWIGSTDEPFALLADAKGVRDTDAEYRATTGEFFGQHRDAARIALLNLSPIIRFVAEMFRVARGLRLKTFPDEAAARAWLRTQGIAA